jgi:lycopene cyclase domain-containing protein
MNRYRLLHILIIGIPLTLSFDEKVHFYTDWPAVFAAIVVVGVPYLVWDALFARAGLWGFSEQHVGTLRIFHLPLEEILFFVTVPYACLFVLQVVRAYLEPLALGFAPAVFLVPALVLGALAWPARRKPYTALALLAAAGFLIASFLALPGLLVDGHFWIYMALTYIPFLIFNGILTAVPVVVYSERAIIGPRVHTIPVEDFLYSFSLLGYEALVFRLVAQAFGG